MRRALALLTAGLLGTAVVEVVAFSLVTRWLPISVVVLLVLVTSALGLVLLRREGVRAWRRFQQAVGAGEPPGVRVADGLVGLVGALLLTVPGLVTDVLGVLLLFPARPLARRAVQRVAEGRMPSTLAGDVFGPRRVRVRRGRPGSAPTATAGEAAGEGSPDASGVLPGPVVEGEIVDPDERR